MRRRGETQTTATASAAPVTPAAAGTSHDWTTQAGPAGADVRAQRPLAQQIEQGRKAGDLIALKVMPTDGPAAYPGEFSPGDLLTVTMGKEIFFPQKFNGFEVGPLSITVAVRVGESAAAAWARARTVLEHLAEAEFQLRLAEYEEHLFRARESVKE